jgi:hypothetical protein
VWLNRALQAELVSQQAVGTPTCPNTHLGEERVGGALACGLSEEAVGTHPRPNTHVGEERGVDGGQLVHSRR